MSTSNQLILDEFKAQALARRLQEQNEYADLHPALRQPN
jgi:hypothetical protein